MTLDFYSILGVEPTATAVEIKERFRFLSHAYHPDKFATAAQREAAEREFKRINEAYQLLSDPMQRANYDWQRTRQTRAESAATSASPTPPSPGASASHSKPSTNHSTGVVLLLWIVGAGMLVFAAIGRQPYSFYTLLRWICCPIFAYSAFVAREKNRLAWAWVFGLLALLYNPIFRVHLDRDTWTVVNWITIGAILVAAIVFRQSPSPSSGDEMWLRGYKALEAGKRHFAAGRDQEAVACFDTAIDSGQSDPELFALRGSYLQTLGWHFDAIDDFSQAISFQPHDCNHYFQRAMSKSSSGDLEGFRADIREAIRLAMLNNSANRPYDEGAREMGHRSAAALYEAQALLTRDMPQFVRAEYAERAKLKGRRRKPHI